LNRALVWFGEFCVGQLARSPEHLMSENFETEEPPALTGKLQIAVSADQYR